MRILLSLLVLAAGCGPATFTSKRPDPSHHREGKFFNPWVAEQERRQGGFFKFLWLRFTQDWASWPEHVDVAGAKPLSRAMSPTLTLVNHATFLIQAGDLNVLTDPIWSERASPVGWAGPKRVHAPAIAFSDLPPIHVVLISHDHYDHMDLQTLRRLDALHHPLFLTGLGNEAFLREQGLGRVKELDWWDAETVHGQRFHFVPAQHFSGRRLDNRNETLWGGFLWETPQGKKIYFAGDTGHGAFFRDIHDRFGAPNVALLPIGAYEPREFMRPVHTNPDDAVRAHLDLKAKVSVGIHFGCFQLTAEAHDAPAKDLKTALARHGVAAEDFRVPVPGRAIILP